jgi:argininosuccinate synthase
MDRIVLAHSGGFVTTVAIPWLAERNRAEVVAVIVDLGHRRELDAVHAHALAVGAARAHVIDAGEEFARDFVLPALQAGARDGGVPMSAALARPLIAKHLVEIARIEGASNNWSGR